MAPRASPGRTRLMWLPRVSAAWQLNRKTILPRRLRHLFRFDQRAKLRPSVSRVSRRRLPPNLTNDFGVNWLAGNPGAGVSPHGGSLSCPQRRDSFRCAFGKLAGSHVCRRTGFFLLGTSAGGIRGSSSGGRIAAPAKSQHVGGGVLLGYVGQPSRGQPETSRRCRRSTGTPAWSAITRSPAI